MKKHSDELPDKIDARESDYLYLKSSKISGAGNGLFTSIPIYKNEIISLFKGEILSHKEASLRAVNKQDGYFINMLDGTIMDSKWVNCFAKYANDAEGLSVFKFRNNSKITVNEQNDVCLVALRNIKISEEIFCSYGKPYWKKFKSNSKIIL
ncbi:MAG: SET domain-containing protein-lysine N-methyltransferase [Bacteroidota bacterium]